MQSGSKFITYLHLVLRLRIGGAIPLLSLHPFMGWGRYTELYFTVTLFPFNEPAKCTYSSTCYYSHFTTTCFDMTKPSSGGTHHTETDYTYELHNVQYGLLVIYRHHKSSVLSTGCTIFTI